LRNQKSCVYIVGPRGFAGTKTHAARALARSDPAQNTENTKIGDPGSPYNKKNAGARQTSAASHWQGRTRMTIYSYYRTSELEAVLEKDRLDAILEPEMLAMQTYCLSQRWFLTEIIKDLNCSWPVEFRKRENGKRLLALLQPGDVILCSKLERICSSSHEVIKLIAKLRERHIGLHIVELGGDVTEAAMSVNFAKIAAIFSALEKRKSAERIKGVKQRQRKQGRYLGGSRPFGYMIHENGRLIENPMEQRVLRKIMDLKRQGKSLRAISGEVSTPVMPISFKTVQRLLQRHAEQG
jgi:DNA invertase Pin-like site-specific DNA recombinase